MKPFSSLLTQPSQTALQVWAKLCKGTGALVLLALSSSAAPQANAEQWTDLSGAHTVEAQMLGMFNESVVLQMLDGRRITIPLANLQAKSRIQAQTLAKERTQSRTSFVKELVDKAEAASAPAPNPLPQPPAAKPYIPPAAGMDCVAQLQWEAEQSFAGHAIIASFDGLPPKLQTEVEALIKMTVQKLDMATVNAVQGALYQVSDLIVTRQNWLFSHPRVESLSPTTREKVEDILLGIAGFLRSATNPDKVNLRQLETMPLRQWLAQLDEDIAPHVAKLAELPGLDELRPTITREDEKDGIVTINRSARGEDIKMQYEKIDGMWVMRGMAAQIEFAKSQLVDVPDGSMGGGPIGMMVPAIVGPVIQPLKDAREASEFHASLEPLFAQMISGLESMGEVAGFNPLAGMDLAGGPGAGRPGGRGEGGGRGGAGRPQSSPGSVRPQSSPGSVRPQSSPGSVRPQSSPGSVRPQSSPSGEASESMDTSDE